MGGPTIDITDILSANEKLNYLFREIPDDISLESFTEEQRNTIISKNTFVNHFNNEKVWVVASRNKLDKIIIKDRRDIID